MLEIYSFPSEILKELLGGVSPPGGDIPKEQRLFGASRLNMISARHFRAKGTVADLIAAIVIVALEFINVVF